MLYLTSMKQDHAVLKRWVMVVDPQTTDSGVSSLTYLRVALLNPVWRIRDGLMLVNSTQAAGTTKPSKKAALVADVGYKLQFLIKYVTLYHFVTPRTIHSFIWCNLSLSTISNRTWTELRRKWKKLRRTIPEESLCKESS